MLTYIIKVSLCWLGFYLIYTFFLSKETFFKTNRWYLLATLLLGAVIPLLEFLPTFQEDNVVVTYVQPLNESVYYVQSTVNEVVTTSSFDWMALFWAVYITGMGLCAIRFLGGLWKIYQLYTKSEVSDFRNYKLVQTDEVHLPFSFFNYLFWSKNLELNDLDGQKIITHEEAHVTGWHSIDVMLMEIINIIFWISPMVYFYKKSIRTVHEYLADAVVLQTTPTKKYGHLLLKQSQSGLQVALANHFIHSQLKQRIVMMTRNKSSRQAMVKYLFALPVILLLFILFSKKEIQAQTNNSNANELDEITIVAHGIPQSEASTTDPFEAFDAFDLIDDTNIIVNFDKEKVKKELRAIASRYDRNASKEHNEKVRVEFNKVMKATYKKHYEHRTEVFAVVDELVKEYNIGWAQESSNANGVRMIDWPSKEYLESKKDARAYRKEHLPIGGEMLKDNPLFVVDGIVKWRNTKSPVSMDEVFSVNILKDKAATDKYGWEAVNGVLEIVTHKGKKKKDYTVHKIIGNPSVKGYEQDDATSKKIREVLAKEKNVIVALNSLIPENIKNPVVFIDGKKITSKVPMYLTVGNIKTIVSRNDKKGILKHGGDESNDLLLMINLNKDFKSIKEEDNQGSRAVTAFEKNGDKKHFKVDGIKLMEKEDEVIEYKTVTKKLPNGSIVTKRIRVKSPSQKTDPVFKVVDEMPRFYSAQCEAMTDMMERKKCAEMEMLKFIYSNIKYPAEAREAGIQGKVIAHFIVEKDGTLSGIEILKDLGGGTGEEVERVLKSSSKWVPAKQNGELVRVSYALPVRFKLEGGNSKQKTTDGNPLIVLDGVVQKGVDLKDNDFINPKDIERIQVLKGESATKLYGEAGKDGVILIYTKTNKSAKEIDEAISIFNNNQTPESAGFNSIKISPNPTRGRINIEYDSNDEAMMISVMDITGRPIFTRNVAGGKNSLNDVDISKAAKGVVLVTFRQGKNVYTEKVILQ